MCFRSEKKILDVTFSCRIQDDHKAEGALITAILLIKTLQEIKTSLTMMN
jgi:hypothetical protein